MPKPSNRFAVDNRSASRAGTRSFADSCFVRFKQPDDILQFSVALEELEHVEVPASDLFLANKSNTSKVVQALDSEALGPVAGRCATCRLFADECPGHFAHLDLAIPVYHPMLLNHLLQILKVSCEHCHHFRAESAVIDAYTKQLLLFHWGLTVEAAQLTPLINGLVFACRGKGTAEPTATDAPAPKRKKQSAETTTADGETFDNSAVNWKQKIQEFVEAAMSKVNQAGIKSADINSADTRGWQEAHDELMQALRTSGPCTRCHLKPCALRLQRMEIWRRPEKGAWIRWHIMEIRDHLKMLWTNEKEMFQALFHFLGHRSQLPRRLEEPWEALFVSRLPIVPPRFRKTSEVGGRVSLHSHTKALQALHHINTEIQRLRKSGALPSDPQLTKLQYDLQTFVAAIYDSSLLPPRLQEAEEFKGIRQILEKKQGLFRNNLMSSRVNNACRSVISPDPSLETNELLLPVRFARKITFPEPLAPYNLSRLSELVRRGTKKYPGAVRVVFDSQNPAANTVELEHLSEERREELVAKMAVSAATQTTVVHRHVMTGDWALFNRQPSLHRGSMLAHRIRVLSNSRTFRFHYVNCKGYNADFDGDEMNVHIPQSLSAQAEAQCLADADRHYIMPTSGKPVRGLIQDVVSMGVLLTRRDSFLPFDAYAGYVYRALHPYLDQCSLEASDFLLSPAILRPKLLWTGKQVVSSVLLFLCRLRSSAQLLHFEGANLVADDLWSPAVPITPPPGQKASNAITKGLLPDKELQEGRVIVRHGQLLIGVMDGKQVGAQAYSLVHAMHEIYGSKTAALTLASLSRLMGHALKYFAFTCSIADLCMKPDAEVQRDQLLAKGNASAIGAETEREAIGSASKSSTEVNQLFPAGMERPFPFNMLSMMTLAGSKGSKTNASQMGIHLGQQSFGGLRVHNMVTGRSLPCFTAHDARACAKAWVRGRFLTGINPSDYYIHSIAGRDGLIDTAIKTASSGYLQRCLIKGLEGLVAQYDYTVRDSDGAVVQFRYGEDGLDPTRAAYLTRFPFYAANYKLLRCHYGELTDNQVKNIQVSPKFASALDKFLENAWLVRDRSVNTVEQHRDRDKQINVARRAWLGRALRLHYSRACVEAGEPVGFIAAQSIGEPSTQMTLNTFHHAGASAEHVTQGIPRLRQLLMAGSVPNPIVRIPIVSTVHHHRIRQLVRQKLLACTLSHLLDPEQNIHCHTTYGHPHRTHLVTIPFSRMAMKQYDVPQEALDVALQKLYHAVGHELKRQAAISVHAALDIDETGSEKATGKKAKADASRAPPVSPDDANLDAEEGKGPHRPDLAEQGLCAQSEEGPDELDSDESDAEEQEEDSDDSSSSSAASDGELEVSEGEEANKSPATTPASAPAKAPTVQTDKEGKSKAKKSARKRKVDDALQESTKKQKSPNEEDCGQWLQTGIYQMQFMVDANQRCMFMDLLKKKLTTVKVQNDYGVLSASIIKDPADETKSALMVAGGQLKELMAILGQEMDCFDFHRLYSSDIHAMHHTFGIEAAYRVFRADIQGVFDSHNIGVDPRHISLIADYCLLPGSWRAFNREGVVADTPGMLHKMSFETSTQFLIHAAVQATKEPLRHPSARLMVGLPPVVGTGAPFDVLGLSQS